MTDRLATGEPRPVDANAAAEATGEPHDRLDPYAGEPLEVRAGPVSVVVRGEDLQAATARAMTDLVSAEVAQAIVGKDPTVWGPEAAAEAAVRLGWLDCPTSSRALLPRLAQLRAEVQAAGLDHVVLAGMGGSSLAPEVITATHGAALTVLDTTDPHQIAAALADRLERTVLVVSSKSGSTIETDSHRRAYEAAFRAAGIDPAERIIVVTDPGSPLEADALAAGYRVVPADPDVGGRYSALTAFGLVPSALAGVDVERLLDEAAGLAPHLGRPGEDPGLLLGAALGAAQLAGRDTAVLAEHGSGLVGFGDWAEQLIAESTGKSGTGILPLVVPAVDSPGAAGRDRHLLALGGEPVADGTTVTGPLGAQFLLWELATAVAGRVLGIDPFNQPNVQESKDNTARLLADSAGGELPAGEPLLVEGPLELYGDPALARDTIRDSLGALLAAIPDTGYCAVMAYLDRHGDAAALDLRAALAQRTERAVTFGWAPRFLHSTGQLHKGGAPVGVFLQVTGAVERDVEIPGRDGLTFGRLQLAQALGDLGALTSRGRPALRVHLRDRRAGLAALLEAARA